jgi:hypothetical protein
MRSLSLFWSFRSRGNNHRGSGMMLIPILGCGKLSVLQVYNMIRIMYAVHLICLGHYIVEKIYI